MRVIKKYGLAVVSLIVSLGAILYGFIDLKINVDRQNTTTFCEEIHLSSTEVSSEVVTITHQISKSWDDHDAEGHSQKGGQYDFTVVNNTDQVITDWSIVLHLPKAGEIDSSWSGAFLNEGTEITYTPETELTSLRPGESRGFGFIMHSGVLRNIQEFTFYGKYLVDMESLPEYRRLLGWFYLWLVLLVGYVVFEYGMYRTEKKRARDMRIIIETMETFSGFIDAKDSYTKGHSKRVSQYVRQLAKKMRFSKEDITRIGYIGLMHDCGKMGIPDAVLNKPGALTPEERKIIESHTLVGGRILENYTAIEGIREGALYHHERYDGKGYPEGLQGEKIPLFARIICVADSFDAMNSDRCYRKHLPKDVIISELEKNAGKQFDPYIARCMVELIREGAIPCGEDE